ncbi:MAG: type II secretion system F family protein, partial [Gammaproteobacteria bacterium]
TYPAFVAVVVIGVLFFLMTYLVPQLMQFIQTMQAELPLHTRLLIAISNVFVHYWYLILTLPFVLIGGGYFLAKRNPDFEIKMDRVKLRMPTIGLIYKKLILTRFSNAFAMLYSSGIPILESLRLCESVVGNRVVEEAVRNAGRQIGEGSAITSAFAATELFPPLVVRMLRIGESTGALEKSLLNVSYFYNREVRESIERLQTVIEPALTVTLGLLMAWVLFSVLGPIYDLISQIKV